jgi:hypothetical protein
MSVAGPTRSARNCSGAMYAGVPKIRLVTVVSVARSRATPKSITRGPS